MTKRKPTVETMALVKIITAWEALPSPTRKRLRRMADAIYHARWTIQCLYWSDGNKLPGKPTR